MTYTNEDQHGGLKARFDNLAVKTKVFGGFGIVLLILCIMGGVSYYSAGQTIAQVAAYSQRVEVGFISDDITANFLVMRRWVRDYSLTGDPSAAKKAQDASVELGKTIQEGLKIIKHPERAAAIKEASEIYQSYNATFEGMVKVVTEYRDGLKSTLDPAGKAMREAFQKLAAAAKQAGNLSLAALTDETLMTSTLMRLNVERFMSRNDNEELTQLQTRQEALIKGLKTMNGMAGGATLAKPYEELVTAVEGYVQAKDNSIAAKIKIEDIIGKTLVPMAGKLQERLEFIGTSIDKDLATVKADTDSLLSSVSMLTMSLSVGALVIGGALAWFIGSGIAAGIVDITSAMRELAGGNKGVIVPYRSRKDEVGAMASALQVFKETAIEADRMAAEQKVEQEKRLKRAEHVSKLVSDFNEAVRAVVTSVSTGASQLKSNAQSLSAIAEETNRQSSVVSAAAEEASRSVESVASAAEELNASIGEINRQIEQSATLANESVQKVKTTNETVETLSSAAQEIGNVVQLIQDIAAQTNLLALNATIEAARAGEAGKGFAVVASEVKTLANQTAKATEDISAQIGRIQTVANQSVEAMGVVGKGVAQISDATTTVAAAAQEQGAATAEISRSIQQVSAGTTEVATNITEVTKAAGETGQMAAQVLAASNELSKQSENLQKVVGTFIEQVKAA